MIIVRKERAAAVAAIHLVHESAFDSPPEASMSKVSGVVRTETSLTTRCNG